MIHSNTREFGRVISYAFKYGPMQELFQIDDFPAAIRQSERNGEPGERLHRLDS